MRLCPNCGFPHDPMSDLEKQMHNLLEEATSDFKFRDGRFYVGDEIVFEVQSVLQENWRELEKWKRV